MGRALSRGTPHRKRLLLESHAGALCMWLLGSPDTNIVSVHLATDMECGFIADESFYEIWDEFDYRVDVCRVTQGAHIEGL